VQARHEQHGEFGRDEAQTAPQKAQFQDRLYPGQAIHMNKYYSMVGDSKNDLDQLFSADDRLFQPVPPAVSSGRTDRGPRTFHLHHPIHYKPNKVRRRKQRSGYGAISVPVAHVIPEAVIMRHQNTIEFDTHGSPTKRPVIKDQLGLADNSPAPAVSQSARRSNEPRRHKRESKEQEFKRQEAAKKAIQKKKVAEYKARVAAAKELKAQQDREAKEKAERTALARQQREDAKRRQDMQKMMEWKQQVAEEEKKRQKQEKEFKDQQLRQKQAELRRKQKSLEIYKKSPKNRVEAVLDGEEQSFADVDTELANTTKAEAQDLNRMARSKWEVYIKLRDAAAQMTAIENAQTLKSAMVGQAEASKAKHLKEKKAIVQEITRMVKDSKSLAQQKNSEYVNKARENILKVKVQHTRALKMNQNKKKNVHKQAMQHQLSEADRMIENMAKDLRATGNAAGRLMDKLGIKPEDPEENARALRELRQKQQEYKKRQAVLKQRKETQEKKAAEEAEIKEKKAALAKEKALKKMIETREKAKAAMAEALANPIVVEHKEPKKAEPVLPPKLKIRSPGKSPSGSQSTSRFASRRNSSKAELNTERTAAQQTLQQPAEVKWEATKVLDREASQRGKQAEAAQRTKAEVPTSEDDDNYDDDDYDDDFAESADSATAAASPKQNVPQSVAETKKKTAKSPARVATNSSAVAKSPIRTNTMAVSKSAAASASPQKQKPERSRTTFNKVKQISADPNLHLQDGILGAEPNVSEDESPLSPKEMKVRAAEIEGFGDDYET